MRAEDRDRLLTRLEVGLVLLALCVRVGALHAFEASPMADHPMVDAAVYESQAVALLDGKDPFAEGYYQPPAYPYLLAAIGSFTGALDLHIVRWVQLFLGVFASWGVARLGRRVGSRVGLPAAGLVAGGLHALYPTAILFEHDLLTPAASIAAMVGGLVCVWAGRRRAGRWRLLAGGVLLGVAVALHPTYLLGAVVVLLGVLWQRRRRAPMLWLALGLALPILPTAIQNAQQFGTLELVSHNAGINFYLGNNSGWRDTSFLRPGLPFRKLALEAEPHKRDLPTRNKWWRDRALSDIAAHPDAWLGALGTKLAWSLSNTEIPRNEDYRCRTQDGQALDRLRLLPVRYGWVFPFALLGAGALWRRGGRVGRIGVPLWVGLHAPMVLFLVSDRYRLGSWPVVAILGGVGMGVTLRALVRWRSGQGRPSRWLLVLPMSAAVPFFPLDPRTQFDESVCTYAQANLDYMEERWADAGAGYQRVLDAHPDDMGAHSWLSYLAARQGDWPEAVAQSGAVLAQFPDHFPTLKARASWQLKMGDVDGAVASYRAAYAVPGNRASTGVRLVKLLWNNDRREEARAFLHAHPTLAADRRLQELQ